MKITPLGTFILSICISPLVVPQFAKSRSGVIHKLAPASSADHPRAGEKAPPLTCTSPAGHAMSWKDFEGKALVLYFHAPRTSNARKAIEQFRDALDKAPELKERCQILLLVDNAEAGEEPRKALASSGFSVQVGVSEKRELFQAYGVLAFPTLFVIDGKASVVDSVRGYGTMFSFRTLAACRYALGIIDQGAFDDLLHGRSQRPSSEDFTATPQYAMARRLIETGKGDRALTILVGFAAQEPPRPALMALVAHLQLLAGDATAARTWVERLAKIAPESLDATMLLARLDLAAGNVDAARGRLRGLDAYDPRVEFVRGLIFEQEERFEDAAAVYRMALGSALFLPE